MWHSSKQKEAVCKQKEAVCKQREAVCKQKEAVCKKEEGPHPVWHSSRTDEIKTHVTISCVNVIGQ